VDFKRRNEIIKKSVISANGWCGQLTMFSSSVMWRRLCIKYRLDTCHDDTPIIMG